jgi:hypothetical protein
MHTEMWPIIYDNLHLVYLILFYVNFVALFHFFVCSFFQLKLTGTRYNAYHIYQRVRKHQSTGNGMYIILVLSPLFTLFTFANTNTVKPVK